MQARIVWAFLALTNQDRVPNRPSVAEALALGRILTTIETSLSQWENGKTSPLKDATTASNKEEATRFASFFGRTRFLVPFIDQRLDDYSEETGDQEEKSRLPLLRDLAIDPLTLCKVACCFERLAVSHEGARASETLTRVALRLLTSRNGRLMRECRIGDLVRLCEAAAHTHASTMREMISHFTRRVVFHLNGPGENSLSRLGPSEIATLVWALGELGVKYTPDKEDASVAHRRLHLISRLPLLDRDQLMVLSNERSAKLVRLAWHRTPLSIACFFI